MNSELTDTILGECNAGTGVVDVVQRQDTECLANLATGVE